jgi:hypothetical protein
MTAITIYSEESLQRALGDLRGLFAKHHYLRLNVKSGKDRTMDQNRILHAWLGQLSRELPENDELGWKAFAKLHYGVPILRAEDEEFRGKYDAVVKPMSYEQKLAIMEFWPVTSIMTIPQLSKFLEAMQAGLAQRGVRLMFPEA